MRSLLELRDRIKRIYSSTEFVVVPVLKFMLAFLTFSTISGEMGYMYQLDNLGLVLIASLLCSFLPNGFIILFAVLISLVHMYALSLEIAIVCAAIYLILFLVFFRFGTKDSLIILFTGILAAMKIPYIVPIVVGLIAAPSSIFAVACGLIAYYMLHHVAVNATAINAMGADEATAKIRLVIDGILDNKEMLAMLIAFSVTIIIVYLIRRLSIDYAWTLAMVAGVIADLVILLLCDLLYDTNMPFGGAFLSSILALAVAKVLEFFRFSVDYSRTENVQFEDDEYYYYVKAIPKLTVAVPSKTVKKINMQRQQPSGGRTVVTERTANTRVGHYTNERKSGRSVTVGNQDTNEEDNFFEDLDE